MGIPTRAGARRLGLSAWLTMGPFWLSACVVGQTPLDCTVVNDVIVMGGKIITVDESDSVESSLRINGSQIVAVGDDVGVPGACTVTIDLEGRTVIPGLIDHHNHWLDRATRPGHHVAEMDTAFSIAEVLSVLEAKAETLPPFDSETGGDAIVANDFVTSIGGFDTAQFAENRMPTREELDTIDHPVFLSLQFDGPAMTNSAGRRYFEARGITVGPAEVATTVSRNAAGVPGVVMLADGEIGQGGAHALAARQALAAEHDFEAQKRGTVDAMVWSARVGLTTNMDQSGGARDYEPYLALHNEGRALTRLRIPVSGRDAPMVGAPDRVDPPEDAVPNLARVAQVAIPNFGNDMVRVQQMAEFIVVMPDAFGRVPIPANYDEAARVVAKYGWSLQQHSIPVEEARNYLTIWEEVNVEYPIADLRWSLTHLFDVGVAELDRLDALGAGAALESHRYTTHVPDFAPGVPPYRTAYEHAMPVGAGSDGGNVTTINPWNSLYFMTTGLNTAGEQILGEGDTGQTVTRRQALEMYTKGNAWFSFNDQILGSLEVGKLADLVVLSEDYDTVPDAELRRMTSVLTIVDGHIVYSDGRLVGCAGASTNGVLVRQSRNDRCLAP